MNEEIIAEQERRNNESIQFLLKDPAAFSMDLGERLQRCVDENWIERLFSD